MTPRQFSYLVERFREENKREDRRAGEVVSILYNINRDTEKDPKGLDWTAVFPEWKEEQREQEEQTDEQMYATMMMLFATKPIEGLSN